LKNKKIKRIALKTLLIVIGILYILFLYMDIFNVQAFIPSNTFKYISIILCFLITLLIEEYSIDKKDVYLLQMGFFVTIFADLFIIKIDFLFAIAFFYSICLLGSTIEAIKAFRNNLYPYPNKHIILWGMVLFLLCDVNVAITYLTREHFTTLFNISSLLIWVFYLPSQVLLSISGYKFKYKLLKTK